MTRRLRRSSLWSPFSLEGNTQGLGTAPFRGPASFRRYRGYMDNQLEFSDATEMEHISGVRRGQGKVCIFLPTTESVTMQLPAGVNGFVYRVVDGVATVNLYIELEPGALERAERARSKVILD